MDVDLNADVGEGFADDERLLDVVTSANVACGFHAGSAETMRTVCAAAAERGVAIGAHPSYRDREGFGRRALDVAARRAARRRRRAARGARRDRGRGRRRGDVRQAARRALHARDRGRRGCARDRRRDVRVSAWPMLAWPGSELFEQARAGGPGGVRRGVRRPRLRERRASCRAISPVRCSPRPRRRSRRWRSRTQARCSRSACTATARARRSWRRRCAPRSSRPGSPFAGSRERRSSVLPVTAARWSSCRTTQRRCGSRGCCARSGRTSSTSSSATRPCS